MRWPKAAVPRTWRLAAAGVVAIFALSTCGRALLASEFGWDLEGQDQNPLAVEAWRNWTDPECSKTDWTIDYRFRAFCSSGTSYEFGTPDAPPVGWSPLSRLQFSLNSSWHGLEVGWRRPTWAVHCEWMMPQQGIQGDLADYDWRYFNEGYSDLGLMQEQWVEGQMLDLGMEFRLTERAFGMPIEVWPIGGFRWQRFNIMAYDLLQVKWDRQTLDPPFYSPGDTISFNQQYYVSYVGCQFRTRVEWMLLPPTVLTVQGDWGYVDAYNVDHHLKREGDRYTMESTYGGAWHIAFIAEVPVNPRVSFGFQFDHQEIRTTGKHHLLNVPEGQDETWTNGVAVSSNQTGLMAFVRLRL